MVYSINRSPALVTLRPPAKLGSAKESAGLGLVSGLLEASAKVFREQSLKGRQVADDGCGR